MDGALELLDPLVLDKAYAWALPYPGVSLSNSSYSKSTSLWPRDNIYRQVISILVITQLGATSLYLMFSALSYYFIFDSRLEYHPRFLQNQIRQEIKSSLSAIPAITILTLPLFLAEVRGKSLLYSKVIMAGPGCCSCQYRTWLLTILPSTGFIAWSITPACTSTFTSHIINGFVSLSQQPPTKPRTSTSPSSTCRCQC